mmetsp:Transcript_11185/g.18394  ORF Transcript_11185/g.18394 Transcript_11185/m.18394 type:complete len:210 (+) Transcript_11185:138-767(+)
MYSAFTRKYVSITSGDSAPTICAMSVTGNFRATSLSITGCNLGWIGTSGNSICSTSQSWPFRLTGLSPSLRQDRHLKPFFCSEASCGNPVPLCSCTQSTAMGWSLPAGIICLFVRLNHSASTSNVDGEPEMTGSFICSISLFTLLVSRETLPTRMPPLILPACDSEGQDDMMLATVVECTWPKQLTKLRVRILLESSPMTSISRPCSLW